MMLFLFYKYLKISYIIMAKSKNSKKETSKNKIDKQQQRKAITGLLFVVIAIYL